MEDLGLLVRIISIKDPVSDLKQVGFLTSFTMFEDIMKQFSEIIFYLYLEQVPANGRLNQTVVRSKTFWRCCTMQQATLVNV